MLLLAWAVGIITLTLGRIAHGRVQRALQRRGIGAERVLIIGTGEVGRMIVQKIQHTPGLGYRVAGFVEASSTGETPFGAQVMGLPVFGTVENLPKIIEGHGIDEVIIGLPEATHQELVGIVSQCEREKVSIRVFPDVFQIMAVRGHDRRPGRPAAAHHPRCGAARLALDAEAHGGSDLVRRSVRWSCCRRSCC